MMKILIGYDGSAFADSALDDLQRAGLPDQAEAVVLAVAEEGVRNEDKADAISAEAENHVQTGPEGQVTQSDPVPVASGALASGAARRVQEMFPKWQVSHKTGTGNPADAIIQEGDILGADLIVVGSQGRSAVGRILLGSVSTKVLHESKCSVRIARDGFAGAAARVVIAVDGSPDSELAVRTVASRNWADGTKFKLITADDKPASRPLVRRLDRDKGGYYPEDSAEAKAWVRKVIDIPAEIMAEAGLKIKHQIFRASPKEILIPLAEEWKADVIFIGARGMGRIKRLFLGSVSSSIAVHATCSVEVVRQRKAR